jgi:3-methyladenine DNA glycosylase AlkD
MKKHVNFIISDLNKIADEKKSAWWNNYLRHEIEFIGVSMPNNRNIILSWQKENQLSLDELTEVADELMLQKIAEYKLAAFLIYQNYILGNISNSEILKHINTFFERKLIFDWNTCDWLCVRVLTPIISEGHQRDLNKILNWYKKDYYWQARAAIVSFTQCKNLSDYKNILHEPMKNLINRPERFAITSVGWLLHEISKIDLKFVEEFLNNNKSFLTKEVFNNALKYANKTKKKTHHGKQSNN